MLKKLLSRTAITAVIILVQIVWIVALLLRLSDALPVMNYVLRILSLVAVLHVIKNDMDPSYKVSWVLFIALLPLFGGLMYVLFGNKRPTRFIRDKLNVQLEETARYYTMRPSAAEEIDDDDARGLFKYLESYSGYRACRDTKTEYFPVGEDMFARLIPELEKAEEFIFLEYFIINSGQMWNSVLDVLRRKVAQGVDVRVIYDDVGCADYLPANYCQTLRSYGIKAMVFNKFVPVVSVVMNNRDHRKITVIDGKVGFIGGINISDEYINKKIRFGYWKDAGIRVEGECVNSFTTMFLEMWNYINKDNAVHDEYLNPHNTFSQSEESGFVQPFCDSPLEHDDVGENLYVSIISRAKKYVYIFTPYLILGTELSHAMISAARSGVDVRIVVPKIPDKKLIYLQTKANFRPLIEAGVRIYLYTPGFIHSKCIVADDDTAIVGTCNLDFRSMYWNFEDFVYMYRTQCIGKIKEDAIETFAVSEEVYEESTNDISFAGRLLQSILQ